MNLLDKIMNALDEDLEKIIDSNVEEQTVSCERCKVLGFNVEDKVTHKGFIALDTLIKYNPTLDSTYDMNTKEIYYEFAVALKNKGLKNKGQLMGFFEQFMDSYFAEAQEGEDKRDEVLEEASKEKGERHIGAFRKKGVATSIEKAVVAQNLLSLFEFESYLCIGSINDTPHAFNIVKAQNKYMLLDYYDSCAALADNTVISHIPFQGSLEFSEFKDMLNNGTSKTFVNYHFVKGPTGYRKKYLDTNRDYKIGNIN